MADETFTYAIYYKPEDTNSNNGFGNVLTHSSILVGRQSHHSIKELFKTGDIEKESLTSIVSVCEVFKFKRYLSCTSEEKFNDKTYFFR